MIQFSLPKVASQALHRLNAAGYEAFVVGGCVRDRLLEKAPYDWDITTSAIPEQIMAVFQNERVIPTGIQHGTVTVILEGNPLEITTYRIDGCYSDGRHPDDVVFATSLEADLCRRDFTVNAMAYHPVMGLIDPYGGYADLIAGRIRCVGDAVSRFQEDALRIIRALRFSAVLGFTIDDNTHRAIEAMASALSLVAVERITAELKKLLCGDGCSAVLKKYHGVLSAYLPRPTTQQLNAIQALPNQVSLRLAALFSENGHKISAVQDHLHKLKLDNALCREVTSLVVWQQTLPLIPERAVVLQALRKTGPYGLRDLLLLQKALHPENLPLLSAVQHMAEALLEADVCYSLAQLQVTGDDLLAVGIPPGKCIGFMLEQLLTAVINGECMNDKESLLAFAKK